MKDRYILAGFSFLMAMLTYWASNHIFFWDTVQFAGRHGNWYYSEGLLSGLLPEHLDSGHPPTFGIYLAGVYRLFGRSLSVAHFAMLPFLILNVGYAFGVGKLILKERFWTYILAMIMCPLYLGHSVLVSPDIILVTGFLASLFGIMSNNKKHLVAGSILLSLISVRGMIVLFLLGLYCLLCSNKHQNKIHIRLREILPFFLPAILLFSSFQLWHVWQTKWIGFHSDSPWSSSFNIVTGKDLIYQTGLYVWRLLDFGMVIIYMAILFFIKNFKRPHFSLHILLIILIVGLGIITVPFSGLINHRYYLPIQLISLLWMLHLTRQKNLILVLGLIGVMGLGNFIIYPDKIAQGWDSTAAHWPFYQLEEDMHNYIVNNSEINSPIGTAYPVRGKRQFLDPASTYPGYANYDLSTDKYILYSNIMNDFTDREIDELRSSWKKVHHLESKGVKMILYQRQ